MLGGNRIVEIINAFKDKEKLGGPEALSLFFENQNNNFIICEVIVRAKDQGIVKEAVCKLLKNKPDVYEMSVAFAHLKNNGNGTAKLKEEIGEKILTLTPDYWTLMYIQNHCDITKLSSILAKKIKQTRRGKDRQHATMLIMPKAN